MNPTEDDILKELQKARTAYLEKDYRQALEKYEWVAEQIKEDKDNLPVIWIESAWSTYYLRDYHKTIDLLEKALQSPQLNEEQRFDCLRLTGFSHEYSGNSQKALEFLEKAVNEPVADATKRFAYFELGKIYFNRRQWENAKNYLEKASSLFQNSEADYQFAAIYYLGFIAYLEKDFPQAESYFRHIIKKASNSGSRATGFFGLAHLYFARKEYPALIDACQKIMALEPNFEDRETLAFFLCTGYMHLKMWNELENFFELLKDSYPNGRYQSHYSTFEEALRNREIP